MKNIDAVFFVLFIRERICYYPNYSASNLHFPAIDGGYLNVAWTSGNGAPPCYYLQGGKRRNISSAETVKTIPITQCFGSGQQASTR
jgi:hypothetical protein